jgi:hypothetical protein
VSRPTVTLELDLDRVLNPTDWPESELTIEGRNAEPYRASFGYGPGNPLVEPTDQRGPTIIYVVEPDGTVTPVLLPKGTKVVFSGTEDFG